MEKVSFKKAALWLTSMVLISSLVVGCGSISTQGSKDLTSGNSTASTENAEELVVGMELAFPPFETTDEKGNPIGISVDFANDIGKALRRPVKIENMAFSGLIPALQTKKIDMVLSSMTITDERKESIDFTDGYAKAWLALLINKDSAVEKVQDLNAEGKKVAVKKGTVGHIYAQEYLPKAEIMVFDKETACALEVSQGKADAMIYDTMSIHKFWKQYESTTRANLQPFEENIQEWGIGLRKEDQELKNQINAFLKEYKEDGGFDRLAEKYLSEQKKDFEELGVDFFF